MSTSERSLVGVKGWLALFLAFLYMELVVDIGMIESARRSFSDPLAVGSVRNDLLAVLTISVIVFSITAVGIWMIHERRPETRQFFLVYIPSLSILLALRDWVGSAMAAEATGRQMGKALATVAVLLSDSYWRGRIAGILVGQFPLWLYWWRSERVKQTFTSARVVVSTFRFAVTIVLVCAFLGFELLGYEFLGHVSSFVHNSVAGFVDGFQEGLRHKSP